MSLLLFFKILPLEKTEWWPFHIIPCTIPPGQGMLGFIDSLSLLVYMPWSPFYQFTDDQFANRCASSRRNYLKRHFSPVITKRMCKPGALCVSDTYELHLLPVSVQALLTNIWDKKNIACILKMRFHWRKNKNENIKLDVKKDMMTNFHKQNWEKRQDSASKHRHAALLQGISISL